RRPSSGSRARSSYAWSWSWSSPFTARGATQRIHLTLGIRADLDRAGTSGRAVHVARCAADLGRHREAAGIERVELGLARRRPLVEPADVGGGVQAEQEPLLGRLDQRGRRIFDGLEVDAVELGIALDLLGNGRVEEAVDELAVHHAAARSGRDLPGRRLDDDAGADLDLEGRDLVELVLGRDERLLLLLDVRLEGLERPLLHLGEGARARDGREADRAERVVRHLGLAELGFTRRVDDRAD